MATPQLNITHITPSQANKEVTANAAFDRLDSSVNREIGIDVSSGTFALTADQFRDYGMFRLFGSPSGPLTMRVPDVDRRFAVWNGTAEEVDVEVASAGTDFVTIPPGVIMILQSFASIDNVMILGRSDGGGGSGGGGGGGSAASANPSYAQAYLSSDDPGQDFTTAAAISWDAANEVGGKTWWASGNPTRLTVPAGVTRVRLKGQIGVTNLTADEYSRPFILKNGAAFDYFSALWTETGGIDRQVQVLSPILDVTPGDYFELFFLIEADTSVDVQSANRRTWFEIEEVTGGITGGLPVAFKGFRFTNNATQAISATTNTQVDFQTTVFDTDSGKSGDTWVVPGSLDGKYMVFSAGLRFDADESNSIRIRKDGVIIAQHTTNDGIASTCTSGPILLEEGDVYDVETFLVGGGGTLQNDARNFFAGHVVETSEDAFDYVLDTGTARTLTAADFKGNRTIKLENASAITLTLNTGIAANGPLTIIQGGAGTITMAGTASLNAKGSATGSNGQFSAFTLIPTETADEYDMIGDIA